MKVTDSVSFGMAIRKRRKELEYTQKFVSDVSGLSVSFISDMENGKATAEIGKVLEYMNLLGLDLELTARG